MQVDFSGRSHGREQIGLLAALQAAHGLGQHLVVKLKAHFQHIAALLVAQHLACTANLQIVHRQIKAAAQLLHLLNRFQALRGLLGQAVDIGHHQIRIGLVMAAAHAPAKLMQLRQAKLVGA